MPDGRRGSEPILIVKMTITSRGAVYFLKKEWLRRDELQKHSLMPIIIPIVQGENRCNARFMDTLASTTPVRRLRKQVGSG